MAGMNKIHEYLGAAICRKCISRVYGVKLFPKDCIYEDYPQMCSHCKKVNNIVAGFSFSGKLKMMFR